MATTTIPWTTLSQGQTYTLDLYDQTYVPNGQILRFNDTAISAANVLITQLDDTLTRFEVSALGKTVILNTDATRVTTSNITFANGSLLLVGDNSYAGALDHDDNTLTGGSLRDYLNGLGGNDTLSGGAGADYLEDAYGFNTLLGGNDGDEFDVFLEVGSANVATGGAGRDIYYLDPKSKSLLAPPGSPGNNFHVTDFVVGPTGDMVLVSDLILISINFNDQDPFAAGFLRFRQVGNNTVFEGDRDGAAGTVHTWIRLIELDNISVNTITPANFPDLVLGTLGNDALTGTDRKDLMQGMAGNDSLAGQGGDDYLSGGAGDDVLNGDAGADKMLGGQGADTYYVDAATDEVIETDNTPAGSTGLKLDIDLGSTIDTVIAAINYTLGNYLENLTLATGSAALFGSGNTLDNAITGNEGNNTLSGSVGNDTLDGGAGTDTASLALTRAQASWSKAAGVITVTSSEGTDRLTNIEYLKFSDETVFIAGNNAPTAGTFGNRSAGKSASLSLNLAALFTDVDGDTLNFGASGLPAGLAINGTGQISGTSPASDGVHHISVTATDSGGLSASLLFDLSISNIGALLSGVLTRAGTPLPGVTGQEVAGSLYAFSRDTTDYLVNGSTKPITAADALDALKLSVGLVATTGSSWKEMISADINRSGSVTAADALEILKISVGINTIQPSWLFVPTDSSVNSNLETMTRSNVSYTDKVSLSSINGPTLPAVIGILVGDVNNSWLIPA